MTLVVARHFAFCFALLCFCVCVCVCVCVCLCQQVFLFVLGKYLNHYGESGTGVGLDYIPPGWKYWFALMGNR